MLPQIFLDYFHETEELAECYMLYKDASLWNELPKYLKDIQSVKKFKELLKLHFLKLNSV